MIVSVKAADIDREQVPEPHNTFDRPWVYYTYIVPEGTLCQANCGLIAHAGVIELDDENKEKWEAQQGFIEGDMTYWCALDYANAIIGEVQPQPMPESEPQQMTEEEMMEGWG